MAAPLPTSQQQYATWLAAQDKYNKQQTGGVSFLTALQAALAGADQQNTTLRNQQQTLTQQNFEAPTQYREELIGQGITDPYKRQALIDSKLGNVAANLTGVQGKLSDLGGQRAQALQTAGGAYDAETQAALQRSNAAGDMFKTILSQEQAKTDREFQAHENALNRANSRANSSIRGGLTIKDLVNNPLLALINAGVKRVASSDGGFNFFDKSGKPITVEEAADLAGTGVSKGELLKNSSNQQDITLDSKPLSAEALKVKTAAESGLISTRKISDMVGNNLLTGATSVLSKTPFGLGNKNSQLFQNNAREISDVLARLRTGAAISQSEEKLYKKYIPNAFESQESQQDKLNKLNYIFQSLSTGKVPTQQDIFGLGATSGGAQTMPDGSQWKQNSDGSFTKVK